VLTSLNLLKTCAATFVLVVSLKNKNNNKSTDNAVLPPWFAGLEEIVVIPLHPSKDNFLPSA
jgi:hypothetical protein